MKLLRVWDWNGSIVYTVEFTETAEDDLASLERTLAQRALGKIRWLAENFESLTPEPLTAQWSGMYKLRVGDYRVLYTFDDSFTSITLHFIRHRREVYRT